MYSPTTDWATPDLDVLEALHTSNKQAIESYIANSSLIKEHLNIEDNIRAGGYSEKQINELVQNATDPLPLEGGRIQVVLSNDYLYCANEGSPFAQENIKALLMAYSSSKSSEAENIGKFGIGFKSVLALSDKPEVFSKTISIRFDHERLRNDLQGRGLSVQEAPKLRAAYQISALQEAETDEILSEFLTWATTIIRVPLTKQKNWLSREIKNFPGEIVLFTQKINSLQLLDKTSENPTPVIWKKPFRNQTKITWSLFFAYGKRQRQILNG